MAAGPIKDQREVGAGRREARRNLERPAKQRFGIAHSPEPRGKFGHHADRGDIVGIIAKLGAQQSLGNIEVIFGQRLSAREEALISGGKGGGRHRDGVPASEVSSKRKTGATRLRLVGPIGQDVAGKPQFVPFREARPVFFVVGCCDSSSQLSLSRAPTL